MALPHPSSSQVFSSDQQLAPLALYFDTPSTALRLGPAFDTTRRYTAFGSGVEFAIFDLLDGSFAPTTRADIETALGNTTKTTSALGYNLDSTYRTGIAPNVYMYWGAGAPPGGSRSKQTLLKFSGFVTEDIAQATIVLAGQGTVLVSVTHNGAVSTVIPVSRIHEPLPDVSLAGVTSARITTEWGYQYNSAPVALTKGDKIEIYYWHNGEAWGGVAAKIIPGTVTPATFLSQLRYAAVIGTSFMAKEQVPIAGVPIRYVTSYSVRRDEGAVSQLDLSVALTQFSEDAGWHAEGNDDTYALVDNADPSRLIQKARMVHFEGNMLAPNGTSETYERFTGYVDDIIPAADGASATISLRGIDGRLAEPFDENNPDRLDYHAHGFILRERATEPVFGIPAFDAWPLELAETVLMMKAGIDAFNLGLPIWTSAPQYGRWRFKDSVSQQDFFGARTFSARYLGDQTSAIPLERTPNYGNVLPLKKDYLPDDDAYLFAPDVTQRLYDRAKLLADHFGYSFYFDALGQCVLTGRNNPMYFQKATISGPYLTTTDGADQSVNVNAVGGVVFKKQDSAGVWTRVIEGHFSRLDLYVGIGVDASVNLNGGLVGVTIEVNDGTGIWTTLQTTQVSTYADRAEAYYYDDSILPDGTNAAILSLLQLPFDHYRVTLAPLGPDPLSGQNDCVYRINGVAVFERDPDNALFDAASLTVRTLSTLENLLTVTPESASKDQRNQVIVVGARKATITDSAKLAVEQNPNNPELEFYVAVAVDPFSIYDPTSPNFRGMKRMTVIFDDKVTDSDFARWLARYILYRQRSPRMPAKFTHTVLPILDLRDALYVVEERNRSVQHRLWVKSFTERWEIADDGTVSATTEIDGDSYPAIPSYQPREDIDVDSLFVDPADGVGEPAINVTVSYNNLYARPVSNAALANPTTIKGFVTKAKGSSQPMAADAINNASVFTLSQPAIPETLYLAWNVNNLGTLASFSDLRHYKTGQFRVLANNPYRHFYYISAWGGTHHPTLTFTFEEGDGTVGIYDKTYYDFPNLNGGQWYALYDYFLDRAAENPFYDPYSSERGNLVEVAFSLLVSGRVRVSVWDANRESGLETLVAWLTAPSAQPDQPEAHWAFMEAGAKSFEWDGVDNVGLWNILNSEDYAQRIAGAFGDKPTTIGATYFASNDKTTNPHTLIGDAAPYNFDADNSPFYTIGQFGQFYVKIEVLNDTLVQRDLASKGAAVPRTVDSTELPTVSSWNPTSQVYIWTHLGEPNQCGIHIQDWIAGSNWVPGTTTVDANWSSYSTPDVDATLRDGKPVRVTFTPRARRGPLFTDGFKSNGYKLTRQVHHKGTTFDQFWTLYGHTWQDFLSKYYQIGATEAKRLTSRMFHNEDHTLEFEDTAWRTGEQLGQLEWIFDPSTFKKDFGNGVVERIRYADYEQLEQLPGFDPKQLGGTAKGERAFLTLAFMAHLFYFSAFTLDRSGRRQWCLNSWTDDTGQKRGFVDRSKIVSSNWLNASETPGNLNYRPYAIVDYEKKGADTYLARSIFVRQWKEPGWATGAYSGNPITKYAITNAHQLKYVQLLMKNFDMSTGTLAGDSTTAKYDYWMEQYTTTGSIVNGWMHFRSLQNTPGGSDAKPTFPTAGISGGFYYKPTGFGTWNFDRSTVEGFFTPNPSRDFHPYWIYPYMPDWAASTTYHYTLITGTFMALQNPLHLLACASSQINAGLRDPAVKDVWYGFAYAESYADGYYNDNPGLGTAALRKRFYGARLEKTVEEMGAQDPTTTYKYQFDQTTPHAGLTEVGALYDYTRQDTLDRFDQYRGVISRTAYADRNGSNAGITESAGWMGPDRYRATSVQPVKPAGTYLVNIARYDAYTLAPIHNLVPSVMQHWVDHVTQWFDMRFHHEYVWTSSRYYPVSQNGGAAYAYTRDEYTKASGWVPAPWWNSAFGKVAFNPRDLLYDAGAWAGWKPDLDAVNWAADPHLRWREINMQSLDSVSTNAFIVGHGGFGPGFAGTGAATNYETWLQGVANAPRTFSKRTNIFDTYYSTVVWPRLAVGPEVPEARSLYMNLSLPERLKG